MAGRVGCSVEVAWLYHLKATIIVRAFAQTILAIVLLVAFVANGSELFAELLGGVEASLVGASNSTRNLSMTSRICRCQQQSALRSACGRQFEWHSPFEAPKSCRTD
jgi:hypothetical protein